MSPTGPRRSKSSPALTAIALTLACATTLSSPPAAAQEFTLHLEPALAIWVDTPQSDRFSAGFYAAVRPGVSLGSVVSLQWSYAVLFTPAADGFDEAGTAHWFTTGVRLRPFGASAGSDHLGGLFVDFNLGYVNTDGLDRFGFDAGLGYGFLLSDSISLGVVARYGHIVQSDDTPGIDPNDGQFASFGLDFGFGSPREELHVSDHGPMDHHVCPAAPECVEVKPTGCPDYDRDGVCDPVDRCPTQPGPSTSWGCPTDPCKGPPIVVLVQFGYDSAALPAPRDDNPQTMDPVLDAVARAVARDASCRVCIVGHASEEGAAQHNETLSRDRADAVRGYMSARGIDRSRMPTTGFGARCQLKPTTSLELNRRVEFRRLLEGESCPTACIE